MATRDTIVISASAGGVLALSTLVAGLPADVPAKRHRRSYNSHSCSNAFPLTSWW